MPDGKWVLKLPKPQQMMLFDARPETFTPMRTAGMVWNFVDVDDLDAKELNDLLLAAWRAVAPKTMQKDFAKPAARARGEMLKPPKYAAIRKIALSLPEAIEVMFHGEPWFQIGKSSFALYSPREGSWIFKLPKPQQMMLFDTRPETFRPMRAGKLVWSYVDVDNLDARELRDLLLAAWREIAPTKLQTGEWAKR
jgi:hypothetical protein